GRRAAASPCSRARPCSASPPTGWLSAPAGRAPPHASGTCPLACGGPGTPGPGPPLASAPAAPSFRPPAPAAPRPPRGPGPARAVGRPALDAAPEPRDRPRQALLRPKQKFLGLDETGRWALLGDAAAVRLWGLEGGHPLGPAHTFPDDRRHSTFQVLLL